MKNPCFCIYFISMCLQILHIRMYLKVRSDECASSQKRWLHSHLFSETEPWLVLTWALTNCDVIFSPQQVEKDQNGFSFTHFDFTNTIFTRIPCLDSWDCTGRILGLTWPYMRFYCLKWEKIYHLFPHIAHEVKEWSICVCMYVCVCTC